MEARQKWSLLNDMFGDVEEVRKCLGIITAPFLARLRVNSFRAMLTAFALTPIGHIHSPSRE
jgi:hypothetical protein